MRLEDAIAIAAGLPEVTEGTRFSNRTWFVGKKAFAWERPLGKADLQRLGDDRPPEGPVLAVRTLDLADKEALLQAGHKGFFTIQHFDGYAAVLIELRLATKRPVRDAVVDAWLAVAPRKLAAAYLEAGSR